MYKGGEKRTRVMWTGSARRASRRRSPSRRGAAAARAAGARAGRAPARGRPRRRASPSDPWRPGKGGGGGVALATVDSEAVSPSKRLFLSSQKWSSAETDTAPFAPSAATAAWASASLSFPPCSWHARRRASASKRAPAACRPSRCASKPVTKNSSTTSSTLWASRSRSNTTASLRRPRGAASRSGGRGGRPSPGLGVGRRSNSGCGACGSGGGVAAAARRRRGGSPPSSRSAVVFSLQPSCPSRRRPPRWPASSPT